MINKIKSSRSLPLEWSNIWMKTSPKILNNYREVLIVPILSIILEELIKNRIMNTLRNNISQFQNGGVKGKAVVDNLFIIRGVTDHALHLGKELCITFFDIEKCFDSLWLEDCINSLWENGIRDDMLSLIYLMNTKVQVTIRTRIGEPQPFICSNVVKQGTVLGPVLNNCSIDDSSKSSCPHYFGNTEIKSLEFVDDIAALNDDMISAQVSCKVMENLQDQKRLTFSSEKCELLRINPKPSSVGASLTVNNAQVKMVEFARYLGDYFNTSGDNTTLCKERCLKAKCSTVELIALCKEIKFGKRQIENMLVLYKAVFLPRLNYNCEAWSNLYKDDYMMLRNAQLNYLRYVMEVSRVVPIAALHLDLGVLPIRYEIEMRQLLFLKGVLSKDPCDPVKTGI